MPRYGFTMSFNPPEEISGLNWNRLEHVSKLTFTPAQRTQLLAALNQYLEGLCRREAMATMEDVKPRIKRICTHATALSHELGLRVKTDSDRDYEMNLQHAVLGEIFPFALVDPKTLLRVLRQLARNSKVWLEQPHKDHQPGRPAQDGLRQLIRTWHIVYRAAGGKGRGCHWNAMTSKCTGPLLSILVIALRHAATCAQSTLPRELVYIRRNRLGDVIRKMPSTDFAGENG